MLVLSRKIDETIVIDGRIHIKVIKTKGQGVRLGIEAPADVVVHRGELYNRLQEFQRPPADVAATP